MSYAKEKEKAKMGSFPPPYCVVVGVPGVMALHAREIPCEDQTF